MVTVGTAAGVMTHSKEARNCPQIIQTDTPGEIKVIRGDVETLKTLTGNVKTLRFDILNFADRPEKTDQCFFAYPIFAHGHEWRISISPNGQDEAGKAAFYVVRVLRTPNDGIEDVQASVTIRFGGSNALSFPSCDFTFVSRSPKKTYTTIIGVYQGGDHVGVQGSVMPPYMDENGTATVLVDLDVYVAKKDRSLGTASINNHTEASTIGLQVPSGDTQLMTFRIEDFAKIEDIYIITKCLRSHGFLWHLLVLPRGVHQGDEFLCHVFLPYPGTRVTATVLLLRITRCGSGQDLSLFSKQPSREGLFLVMNMP